MKRLHRTVQFLFFLVTSLVIFTCCQETDSSIGFSGVESSIETIMVDTFTVQMSTVLLDSIHSSGTNRTLVGVYRDPILGVTTSSAYFQIASNTSTFSITTGAVYDSIALLLTPDGYYYGDTTVTQRITVKQLSQDIVGRTLDKNIFKDVPASYFFLDGGLYNTSKENTMEANLGTLKYKPQPNNPDSIWIRLNDDLGKEWFELARNNDQQIIYSSNFLSQFKGIKLSSDAGAVIGFSSSKMKVRVYYHEPTTAEYVTNSSFDVPLYSTNTQFNQIEKDFSSTDLVSIERGKSLSSILTNNESYIQGGAGLITKLEFPYFHLLTELNEHVTLLHSILTITAVQEYPQTFALPSQLVLYYANDLNVPTNVMVSETSSSSPNAASLNRDAELNAYANYSFSINSYVTNLVNRVENYPKELFVGLNSTDFPNTVNRLRIGNQSNPNFKVKLQIYYSRYKNSQ
jgi:hypothetical protein